MNYGKLYSTAITNGWHEQQLAANTKEAQKQAKKDSAENDMVKQRRIDAENGRRDKDEKIRAWAWFETLSAEKQQAMEEAYLAQASKPEIHIFGKRGREAAAFRIFLRLQLND